MTRRALLTLMLLFAGISLHAAKQPPLFHTLSEPLYAADSHFSKLGGVPELAERVTAYSDEVKAAKGLSESLESDAQKQAYLKALRHLQQSHDTIISDVKRELMEAIRASDHPRFLTILDAEIEAVYKQPSLKDRILQYYKTNKSKGRSVALERRMASERGYEKVYNTPDDSSYSDDWYGDGRTGGRKKTLILLYTSWCPACKKAKADLSRRGISYVSYDVEKSSKGKELYRKVNGHAVPTFIIGDESMAGYSPEWIERNLK